MSLLIDSSSMHVLPRFVLYHDAAVVAVASAVWRFIVAAALERLSERVSFARSLDLEEATAEGYV